MRIVHERQWTVVDVKFATSFERGRSKAVPPRDARALLRILKLTLSADWPAPRDVLRCNEKLSLDENGY